jgi:hypothetical protein
MALSQIRGVKILVDAPVNTIPVNAIFQESTYADHRRELSPKTSILALFVYTKPATSCQKIMPKRDITDSSAELLYKLND